MKDRRKKWRKKGKGDLEKEEGREGGGERGREREEGREREGGGGWTEYIVGKRKLFNFFYHHYSTYI